MLKTLIIAVVVALVTGVTVFNLSKTDPPESVNTSIGQSITEHSDPAESGAQVKVTEEVKVPSVNLGQTLDLSGKKLTKTPSYVFGLTDMEALNLSNNNLDGTLQAEVRHLQNLRVLNLSDNNFTGVPAEIGQLNQLEVLNLSNNQLTGLPYELGNLSNLKILNLKGNNYSAQDLSIIQANLPSTTVVQTD